MGRWRSRPVSRVLSWTVIPLGATSPLRSSSLPGPDAGDVMGSLFGLAPGGVCRAGLLPGSRCALTAPFHPCHAFRRTVRRYLSVALSVGSRRPGVTWHRALWSPDFPRHSRRSDATVWPTPPWAFYGFGDEYPRIRLRGCRTGSRSDPIVSVAQGKRESGKAGKRSIAGLRGAAMPWGWGASLGTTSCLYSGRGTSMCHLRPTPRAWRPREASRAQLLSTPGTRVAPRHEATRSEPRPGSSRRRGGPRGIAGVAMDGHAGESAQGCAVETAAIPLGSPRLHQKPTTRAQLRLRRCGS